MNKEKTHTKRWEVTIQRTAVYGTQIQVEAETEEEAEELAKAQAENGEHWEDFAVGSEMEVTYEVTDSTCLSED